MAQIVARADGLPRRPVAIEAFWDGDTAGWFLVLVAILDGPGPRHSIYTEHDLAVLRGAGGDLRVFNGHVPPWPESVIAKEAGEALAKRFDVPFYFPSPDEPDDQCVRWWNRDRALACKECGKPLEQEKGCPRFGTCYPCHCRAENSQPHLLVQLLAGDLSEGEYRYAHESPCPALSKHLSKGDVVPLLGMPALSE